ncbi:PepSY-associated TM helix domain-containing protein [Sphingomonas sp. ac-8]|uniref:PepSY-associated TM helix domain-containing protein n=1 Tax=Sphingomonas sp. ac-8 TaxID=3242977 RepID=UPI003A7FEB3F
MPRLIPVPPRGGLYRAVWRWHFYAGLLVLPFLAWLAITGGLYLYKPELERLIYPSLVAVEPTGTPLALEAIVDRVRQQTGDTVVEVDRPARADRSWRLLVARADRTMRTAWVDPYRGTLLGVTRKGGVLQTVRDLHSLILTGPIGNALIEAVAGWAILLVATGVYLWWPRGGSPAIGVRGKPRARLFWRDLHASVGIVAGAVVLFLALTGLPWTGVWGSTVRGAIASHGLGRPEPPQAAAVAMPGHGDHSGHDVAETLPWSLQEMPMPHGSRGDIGLDRAAALAERHGMTAPWVLSLPAAPGEPYLFSKTIRSAGDGRALYLDAGSGAVLQDARFPQFGPGAQWVEWGIATHKGEQYGEPNRLLMLFGCIAILLLSGSAAVMWWKRRPPGTLAAPPRHSDRRSARVLLAMMLAGGVLFPLTGLTMLVALAAERLAILARKQRA